MKFNPETKRRAGVLFMLVIIAVCIVLSAVNGNKTEEMSFDGDMHMEAVRAYMQSEYTAVFSPYYDMTYVTDLTDYKEYFREKNGFISAEFVMNAVYKNYYKDPDTVPYIIEAKNSGNTEEYKRLYDEYNNKKDATFNLRAEGRIRDGEFKCDRLYSLDANGEWIKLKDGLAEYIISE